MADYLGKKIKFNIEDNDLQKIRFNKVYGESTQETRSGKNYFDASQIPSSTNIVVSDNGKTITMPIATSGGGATPTTKKLSQLCPKLKVGDTAILRFNRNLGTTKNMYIYLNVVNLTWNINSPKAITQEMLDSYVSLFANRYDDGETGQCILTDFSIMLSSETDTSWEQYGASPSPDYPSKIENIEGRNILQNKQKTQTINGVTFTVNKDKSVSIKGTVTADASFYFYTSSNYLMLKKGTYTLSGVNGGSSTSYKMLIYKTDWTFIGQDIGNGVTFTLEEDANVFIYIWVKNGITVNTTVYPQLEGGTIATPYVPYNSLEFKVEGKNLARVANGKEKIDVSMPIIKVEDNTIKINGTCETKASGQSTIKFSGNNIILANYIHYMPLDKDDIILKPGEYKLKIFNVTGEVSAQNQVCFGVKYQKKGESQIKGFVFSNGLASNKEYSFTLREESQIGIVLNCTVESSPITFTNVSFKCVLYRAAAETMPEFEPYKQQTEYFPLLEGQKLYEDSYLADDGIHHKRGQVVFDGSREYIRYTSLDSTNHNCFYTNQTDIYVDSTGTQTCLMSNYFKGDKFDNRALDIPNMWVNKFSSQIYFKVPNTITTVEELKAWLSNNPPTVEYELAEEEIVPYTETQQEAWEKLRHFKGLNGENNITAQGTMTSTLDLTLYNVAEEDFDIYISKKGYFGALKYDINNLIDFMESNIPSIAEATESSVKIAGRDGDIPLNTVYEPLPFEIVCYTEDNLTPEEKIIEEQKITSLLNSIKNQTKTFFMEREKKFYKVKYSGNLSVVRYPKHLKFTIPLKSSESYAMNCEESEIIGNGIKISNTIKETGAIFTIKGPAIKPIISLNNYQMKYNEDILEGNSLIINSEDSTITHITSAGVKTNAMRAYNHEFPKIKNGENQLAVSSGIDDENQVNVKWYDLKI